MSTSELSQPPPSAADDPSHSTTDSADSPNHRDPSPPAHNVPQIQQAHMPSLVQVNEEILPEHQDVLATAVFDNCPD